MPNFRYTNPYFQGGFGNLAQVVAGSPRDPLLDIKAELMASQIERQRAAASYDMGRTDELGINRAARDAAGNALSAGDYKTYYGQIPRYGGGSEMQAAPDLALGRVSLDPVGPAALSQIAVGAGNPYQNTPTGVEFVQGQETGRNRERVAGQERSSRYASDTSAGARIRAAQIAAEAAVNAARVRGAAGGKNPLNPTLMNQYRGELAGMYYNDPANKEAIAKAAAARGIIPGNTGVYSGDQIEAIVRQAMGSPNFDALLNRAGELAVGAPNYRQQLSDIYGQTIGDLRAQQALGPMVERMVAQGATPEAIRQYLAEANTGIPDDVQALLARIEQDAAEPGWGDVLSQALGAFLPSGGNPSPAVAAPAEDAGGMGWADVLAQMAAGMAPATGDPRPDPAGVESTPTLPEATPVAPDVSNGAPAQGPAGPEAIGRPGAGMLLNDQMFMDPIAAAQDKIAQQQTILDQARNTIAAAPKVRAAVEAQLMQMGIDPRMLYA